MNAKGRLAARPRQLPQRWAEAATAAAALPRARARRRGAAAWPTRLLEQLDVAAQLLQLAPAAGQGLNLDAHPHHAGVARCLLQALAQGGQGHSLGEAALLGKGGVGGGAEGRSAGGVYLKRVWEARNCPARSGKVGWSRGQGCTTAERGAALGLRGAASGSARCQLAALRPPTLPPLPPPTCGCSAIWPLSFRVSTDSDLKRRQGRANASFTLVQAFWPPLGSSNASSSSGSSQSAALLSAC